MTPYSESQNAGTDVTEAADNRTILVEAGLLIDDSMSLSGLSESVDSQAVPVTGIPNDMRKSTGTKVDCALCGHKRSHFIGFVVTFADGRRALIGIECAENKLFEIGAWEQMRVASRRSQELAIFDAKVLPARAALQLIIPLIQEGLAALRLIDRVLGDLASELPEIYSGLAQAARRDDRHLQRSRPAKALQADRDGDIRQMHTEEAKVFAILPSAAPFRSVNLSSALSSLSRNLMAIQKSLENPEPALKQLQENSMLLRRLRTDCEFIAQDSGKCEGYFSLTFWGQVKKWGNANPRRDGNYRLTRRLIRHSDEEWDYGKVEIPAPEQFDLSPLHSALRSWPSL